jgi:mRNA interferase MazF
MASGGVGHAGRPRPVVILQDDRLDATASITVCALPPIPRRPWRLFQRPEKGGVSAGIEAKARAIHQSLISDGQRARQNVVRQAALGDLRDPRC